jgi:hypothetical protein
MQATYRGLVVGLVANKGVFTDDSGRQIEYDYTKAHVQLVMRAGPGAKGRGVATEAFKIGDSALYDKLAALPMPFEAEFQMQKVSNGKEDKEEIIGFLPVVKKVA